jgi:hypothetical protein
VLLWCSGRRCCTASAEDPGSIPGPTSAFSRVRSPPPGVRGTGHLALGILVFLAWEEQRATWCCSFLHGKSNDLCVVLQFFLLFLSLFCSDILGFAYFFSHLFTFTFFSSTLLFSSLAEMSGTCAFILYQHTQSDSRDPLPRPTAGCAHRQRGGARARRGNADELFLFLGLVSWPLA